jgi:endonuclease/exonuclease/phosphatase family metal-dependent hydrolase
MRPACGTIRFGLRLATLSLAMVAGTAPSPAAEPATTPTEPAAGLCVVTYNLRFASPTGPNAWPIRRPLVVEAIRRLDPDVMGTQEGLYQQLRELASDLPDYDWIGLGRDGGSRGEFMAVFYRRSRLEPMAFDHFWLSDTPDRIGSATWGNRNRRMVTWVQFLDRTTGQRFYFWNTHLDHEVQAAREKGAALIRERVASLKDGLPVVLVGDFNAAAGGNPAYDILTRDGFFTDTWLVAGEREGENLGTFNGFEKVPVGGPRIDWILVRGRAEVARVRIDAWQKEGRFPSDHFPVAAWLRLVAGP